MSGCDFASVCGPESAALHAGDPSPSLDGPASIIAMHGIVARLRSLLARRSRSRVAMAVDVSPAACSGDAMHEVHRGQAARSVPEAIDGLRLIEQGRWPSSGRPRVPVRAADR